MADIFCDLQKGPLTTDMWACVCVRVCVCVWVWVSRCGCQDEILGLRIAPSSVSRHV